MTTKVTVDAHAGWPVEVFAVDRYSFLDGRPPTVRQTPVVTVPAYTANDFYVHSCRDLIIREQPREYDRKPPLDFADVVRGLKAGKRYARAGWNGKGMFIFLVNGSTFKVNREPLLTILGEGTEVQYHAHVDMKTATGEIVPWLASQSDVLAEDWQEV